MLLRARTGFNLSLLLSPHINRFGSFASYSKMVSKSNEEWRAILSPEQFRILRQKGTEPAGSGEYNNFSANGTYNCAGCGFPLYKSTTKFNSHCGWPAFYVRKRKQLTIEIGGKSPNFFFKL